MPDADLDLPGLLQRFRPGAARFDVGTNAVAVRSPPLRPVFGGHDRRERQQGAPADDGSKDSNDHDVSSSVPSMPIPPMAAIAAAAGGPPERIHVPVVHCNYCPDPRASRVVARQSGGRRVRPRMGLEQELPTGPAARKSPDARPRWVPLGGASDTIHRLKTVGKLPPLASVAAAARTASQIARPGPNGRPRILPQVVRR